MERTKKKLESEFQKRKEDIDQCFEEIEITMKRRHETLIEQIQAIHDMKCLFSLLLLFSKQQQQQQQWKN